MAHIFLSYSRRDLKRVRRLARQLEAAGYEVWIDQHRIKGGQWKEEIADAIGAADAFLIALSPAAVESKDVKKELGIAEQKGIPIYPAEIEAFADLKGLTYDLSNVHTFDLADIDTGIGRLLEALPGGLTGRRPRAGLPDKPLTPPSGLWATIKGWLDYRKAKPVREALIQACSEKDLFSVFLKEFTAAFQEIQSSNGPSDRPSGSVSANMHKPSTRERLKLPRVMVITGPAGVGKTKYLNDRVKRFTRSIDVLAVLDPSDIRAAIEQGDPRIIWSSICMFFAEASSAALRSFSPAAIAYALAHRRVLLVIEDLHIAGPVRETLTLLEKYLSTYHRSGRRLSLLTTTREPYSEMPEPLTSLALITKLNPLAQSKAQQLFFGLCTGNGLDPTELTRHGDKLASAFARETVRVPLFVVLSAWLSVRGESGVNVGRVLEMSASQVFDAFIEKLYDRSVNTPFDSYEEFLTLFEGLALALWPHWEELPERQVLDHLDALAPQSGLLVNLTFFTLNGFLARMPLRQRRLAFPHQAMADYLAAAAMVRASDFAKLREHHSVEQIRGLVPFLSDLIETDELLEALALADLSALVGLVDFRAASVAERGEKAWRIPVPGVVRAAVAWASPTAPRQSGDTWARLAEIMDARSANWIDGVCRGICELGPPSPAAVRCLAALGRREGEELLVEWLDDSESRRAFTDACDEPRVVACLSRLAQKDGLRSTGGWVAFELAWLHGDAEAREALRRWIGDYVPLLSSEEVRTRLQLCRRTGLKCLGNAAQGLSIHAKRRLSSASAITLKEALIPSGSYDVPSGGRRRERVRIRRPTLVPCLSQKIEGPFKRVREVRERVTGQFELSKIMTKHEALVALNYFAHDPLRPTDMWGIMFLGEGEEGVPQVFRVPGGTVDLFDVPVTGKTSVSTGLVPQGAGAFLGGRVIARAGIRVVDRL